MKEERARTQVEAKVGKHQMAYAYQPNLCFFSPTEYKGNPQKLPSNIGLATRSHSDASHSSFARSTIHVKVNEVPTSFQRGGLTCDYWCTIRIGESLERFELVSCTVAFLYPFFLLNMHRYYNILDTSPGYVDLGRASRTLRTTQTSVELQELDQETRHLKNSTSGSCIQDFGVLKNHILDHEDMLFEGLDFLDFKAPNLGGS